ncbi:MAG: type I glyceraldehyde-3-phosphate dehydrogenase [Patescibacteria group bacterium]|nr:type I glyceraldehyde-3-phosphate dehydrogenase [bacterium]MDZ4240833.1 type I glyceraldehyde-3-phosphate dehydrogenase [Patescibacteria group bacterium]
MSEKVRVAINGAGRIGRAFLKIALKREEMELVAINDLGDVSNMAYLLKYDTVYGVNPSSISVSQDGKKIVIDGKEILCLSEKDPGKLPWKDLSIDVVVESTGFFASYEKARAHISAGAKRVVISAPVKENPKDESEATVLMGINDDSLKTCEVSSNASCTTNAGSPVIQILHETIGIEKALLNTVHAYTATQSIVDSPGSKDFRNGRAAAQNIIPASTGAAISTTEVVKDLKGLFDGIAIRVPVAAGSIADITFISKRPTSAEEVNDIFRKAAKEKRWQNIFTVTEDPIVSSDILGSHYASIVDLALTRVVGGNLVKVLAWYDNEVGYTYTLVEHVIKTGHFAK